MPSSNRFSRNDSASDYPEQANASLYSNIAFLNAPFQSLRAGWVPWALFALALVVYGFTVQPDVFPGAPATAAASALGATPNLNPTHWLWKKLLALVAGSGAGMMLRANWVSVFFAAAAVGLCYSVMLGLLTLIIEPTQIGHLPAARHPEGARLARSAARLGALCASLALAFCLPFWISATRTEMHTFYVAWLLLSAQLILLFMRHRTWPLAFLWAFVHFTGMTQTSAFIDFLPLLGFLFLYVLWGDSDIRLPRFILAASVGALLGLGVLFLCVHLFQLSPGWSLNGSYTSYLNAVARTVKGLVYGTRGGLNRAPWLILLGLTIAPWAASLIVSRRAVNGENEITFYFLHAVITVIALLVLFDFRASPWRFMGTNKTTVVPYVLVSTTFGYIAAYLYLLPTNLWANSESNSMQRFAAVLRRILAVALVAATLVAAVRNFREADNRNARVITLYCDAILDSLDGREWLVTSGIFDEPLLLRAKERGIPLHCLNPNTPVLRRARRELPDIRLKNAAGLGLQALVQEWIASFENAPKEFALDTFPDLWSLGKYEVLPQKFVFLGATQEELKALDPDEVLREHTAFWDEMVDAFSKIPANEDEKRTLLPGDAPSLVMRSYRDYLFRPRMSFAGNNLGYTLSMFSRQAELPEERRKHIADIAYQIYTRVHEFDPGNVSALLNWSSKVFEREPEEQRTKAREELNQFARLINENFSVRSIIWSLSRYCGYIEDPGFFAVLGWSWATSGQPNLALQALSAAQNTMPEHAKLRIKSALAQIYLSTAKPDQSESMYREILLEDPGNHEALMGLVNICAFRGDTAGAREFLARAEKAGVPFGIRQVAAANLYNIEGDEVNARATLQSVVDADPENTAAWSMLCALLYEQKNARDLGDIVRILENRAGPDAYQTLIAKGMLAEIGGESSTPGAPTDDIQLRNNLAQARNHYLRASRIPAQSSNVVLLRRILSLDFRIVDKAGARQHAERLLLVDLNDPFANYIMGSLCIDDGNLPAAEAYLRRAADKEPTLASLNDLADVLYRLEKFDEAEERVQQASAMPDSESSYELWDTKALLLTQRGDYDGAEEALQKSLALYGEDMRIHLHLANVYFLSNQKNLAIDLIRTIAPQAQTLPRVERKLFEDLHFKLLGVRYSEKNYQKK